MKRAIGVLVAALALAIALPTAAFAYEQPDPTYENRRVFGADVLESDVQKTLVTAFESNTEGAIENLSVRVEDNVLVVEGTTELPPATPNEEYDKQCFVISYVDSEYQGNLGLYPYVDAVPQTANGKTAYHFVIRDEEIGPKLKSEYKKGRTGWTYRIQLFRGLYKVNQYGNPIVAMSNLDTDILYHNINLTWSNGLKIVAFDGLEALNDGAYEGMAKYDGCQSFSDPSLADMDFVIKDPTQIGSVARPLNADEQAFIKGVAQRVTANASGDYEKAKAIYEYVANHLYYDDERPDNTKGDPALVNPYVNLKGIEEGATNGYNIFNGKAATNCAGFPALFAAMARSIGIPTRIVYGTHSDNMPWTMNRGWNTANHHWSEFYCNGRWIVADCNLASGNHFKYSTKEFKGHGLSNYTFFDPSSAQIANNLIVKAVYVDASDDPAVKGDIPSETADWKRLWGDDAYGTMQAVVKEGFDKSEFVIIATFDGYWDALSASSLAGQLHAPILLTGGDTLNLATRQEIGRLGASSAYIVGGAQAISEKVETQLTNMKLKVKRFYGTDAMGTARAIAQEVNANYLSSEVQIGAGNRTCIIATVNGYWDALAASPYAYASQSPIYLTEWDGTLSKATIDAIGKGNYDEIVIVGGPKAVSTSVVSQLARGDIPPSKLRCQGATAVETSMAVAKYAVERGMSANGMGVATMDGYWDALTGGPLCGKNNAVLVLASEDNIAAVDGFIAPNKRLIDEGYVFGGTSAVPTSVYAACVEATRR